MEEREKEHIRISLPKLMENTDCSVPFLAILGSKNILSSNDVDRIVKFYKNLPTKTRAEKAVEMYRIAQTRTGAYDALKYALKETHQSGAFDILDLLKAGESLKRCGCEGKVPFENSKLHFFEEDDKTRNDNQTLNAEEKRKLFLQGKANINISFHGNELLEQNEELLNLNKLKITNNPVFNQPVRFYENGNTELHIAIRELDEDIVTQLLKNGADINARNASGQTPLHLAARRDDKMTALKMIKLLIETGANPYIKSDDNVLFLNELIVEKTNLTPEQFQDITKYLIDKNLVNLFNENIWNYNATPFHWAARALEIDKDTLKLLQENGVDFNAVNNYGNSIYYFALSGNRSVQFIANLVKFGANWRQLTDSRQTVLHTAANFGHVEAVQLFINLGINVNSLDKCNQTPLHRAAKQGKSNILETVQVLLANGAAPNMTNGYGSTPFDLARKRSDLNYRVKDELKALLRR